MFSLKVFLVVVKNNFCNFLLKKALGCFAAFSDSVTLVSFQISRSNPLMSARIEANQHQ